AGLLLTVTLTPPSCVGIWPLAKEGAVLQMTPAEGVLAGTRFVPRITIKSFCAIVGLPKAVSTEVIVGIPGAGWINVPEPVSANVPSLFNVMFAARVPVAPL